MIRQIAPQFFTTDLSATLAYYRDKLGFDCLGTWNDPPVYAIGRGPGLRLNSLPLMITTHRGTES